MEAQWYLGSSVKAALPQARDACWGPEPEYSWDHYMASPDATDREGRNFTTKARWVVAELWVSHPRTKMVEISHSVSIFGIMIALLWLKYRVGIYAGFLQVRGRL